MPISKHELNVAWTKMIAPNVIHIGFEADTPIDYLPGQFMTLKFQRPDSDKPALRSFSIANAPGTKCLEIAAHLIEGGIASSTFSSFSAGDKISMTGPVGRLVLPEKDPKRYICIATGTGVTPYRAMLPEFAKRMVENQLNVECYLGVRKQADLLFAGDFIQFSNQQQNFQFYACLSQETEENLHEHQFASRVTTQLPKMNLTENDVILLCGNPDMIDDAMAYLENINFPKNLILREKYTFSK